MGSARLPIIDGMASFFHTMKLRYQTIIQLRALRGSSGWG